MPDRLLRLVCAFAVALVTTFHVCDVLNGKTVELVSASAATSEDGGKAPQSGLASVEKCHMCAVAGLPVVVTASLDVSIARVVPQGLKLGISTFDQPIIGPPPRA